MKYHLAGAYDSNIALLLTVGNGRLQSYQNMAETLRTTEMRGKDLATNLEFHYGLVNWFLGNNINARPTTGFIVPYLSAVGKLKQTADTLDLAFAYQKISQSALAKADEEQRPALKAVLERKALLLTRPIENLIAQPHVLAGWLSKNRQHFTFDNDSVQCLVNPINILADTYHFLNMDFVAGNDAANMIWDHDHKILSDAQAFYQTLDERLGCQNYTELQSVLAANDAPKGIDQKQWPAVQAAHQGYQAGCEALNLLPLLAANTGFYQLQVNADLSIHIPESLQDGDFQNAMRKVLAPPPVAASDEVLAATGGMFYSREAPGMDTFVQAGDHFNAGDPLYIIEVMKMFNKVSAPFAGTIDEILVETDGTIITKGQTLFKITPDEKVESISDAELMNLRRASTQKFLAAL